MCKATLTLHDAAEACRANQVSISEERLAELISAEKIPYCYSVEPKTEKGRRSWIISAYWFYKWLDRFLGQPAVRAYGIVIPGDAEPHGA